MHIYTAVHTFSLKYKNSRKKNTDENYERIPKSRLTQSVASNEMTEFCSARDDFLWKMQKQKRQKATIIAYAKCRKERKVNACRNEPNGKFGKSVQCTRDNLPMRNAEKRQKSMRSKMCLSSLSYRFAYTELLI